MAGLPDILIDRYHGYKRGTEEVLTWLALTAAECARGAALQEDKSLPLTLPPTNKRATKPGTSKRKRLEREKAGRLGPLTINVRVADIVRMATQIATSGAGKVPTPVLRRLKKVIDARKECGKWYKQKRVPSSGNDTHEFFVNELQKVHDHLASCEIISIRAEKDFGSEDTQPHLNNVYNVLDLEEPLEIDYGTGTDNPPPPRPNVLLPDLGNDESTTKEETTFALFCCFKDITQIREFIFRTWQDYSENKCTLTTAAMVSNTAMDFIKHLNDELCMKFPEFEDHAQIIKFLQSSGLQFGTGDSSQPDLEQQKMLDSLFCYHTWTLLDHYSGGAITGEKPFASDSATDKLIHNMYMNLEILLESLQANHGGYKLFQGFHKSRKEGSVSSWLAVCFDIVFQLQTLHSLWGCEIDKAYEELCGRCHRVLNVLDEHQSFAQAFVQGKGVPGLRIQEDHFKVNHTFLKEYIRQCTTGDFIDEIVFAFLNTVEEKPKESPRSDDKHFLFSHDPILSGLVHAKLDFRMHHLGLGLTAADDVFLASAHLYNAAKQNGLIKVVWADMESLISIHTESFLFVGGFPTTPDQCMKKFALATCISPQVFAKNKRAIPDWKAALRLSREPRRLSPTSSWLKHSQDTKEPITMVEDPVRLLWAVVEEKTAGLAKLGNDGMEDAWKRLGLSDDSLKSWRKTQKLSHVDMLHILASTFREDSYHLNFNYLSFVERCFELMARIYKDVIVKEPNAMPASSHQVRPSGGNDDVEVTVPCILIAHAKKRVRSCLETAAKHVNTVIHEEGDTELTRASAYMPLENPNDPDPKL